ncbi:MAG: shikimate kinase [Gammaproteobacteria bacterium]|nr:shikimate kinase [Gammaproteobacteria bacterium]
MNTPTSKYAAERIFLIGPMGVGKTTIGLQLAQHLGYQFIDSDKVVEERTGATIPLIFEVEGEAGFRQRETLAIDELTQLDRVILATGGGAVISEQNRRYLAERGTVVFLHADIDQLFERTSKDRNRPLLQTDNPKQKLEQIFQARKPFYQEIADIEFDTGEHCLRDTIRLLLRQIQKYRASV